MYKKYRVIAMQDEHTVLIDYGLTNGTRIGGTLYIIKPHKDIALSGKDNGSCDEIKAIIEVVAPYENFSVCRHIAHKNIDTISTVSAGDVVILTRE